MSLAVGVPILECLTVVACGRYLLKRFCHSGSFDSDQWELASPQDFRDVPRLCRVVLAVYEEDLSNPRWPPEGGYGMDLNGVVKRVGYDHTQGRAPPYLIYVDHNAQDIVVAIRGLNLGREQDYAVLLDNRLGQEMVDGGYVHHGLYQSAAWLLNEESETLTRLVQEYPSYTLTLAGHSLGSGVAAMFTMIIATDSSKVDNIPRDRIRCYAIAPARCMSLNLALRYADIIHSVILQDDFLPRTATPLQDIFQSIFCLPCLLFIRCTRDTCIPEKRWLRDPRRLYTPGRVYHIVERKFCGCGRYPPIVRTAVPVEGRFEHVVLSCNATTDHSLVWMEKESRKALKVLMESQSSMESPSEQKMERLETFKKQHKAALNQALSLKIPNAFSPDNGHSSDRLNKQDGGRVGTSDERGIESVGKLSSPASAQQTKESTNWEELTGNLTEKNDSVDTNLKTEKNTTD